MKFTKTPLNLLSSLFSLDFFSPTNDVVAADHYGAPPPCRRTSQPLYLSLPCTCLRSIRRGDGFSHQLLTGTYLDLDLMVVFVSDPQMWWWFSGRLPWTWWWWWCFRSDPIHYQPASFRAGLWFRSSNPYKNSHIKSFNLGFVFWAQ